jgi:sortase A
MGSEKVTLPRRLPGFKVQEAAEDNEAKCHCKRSNPQVHAETASAAPQVSLGVTLLPPRNSIRQIGGAFEMRSRPRHLPRLADLLFWIGAALVVAGMKPLIRMPASVSSPQPSRELVPSPTPTLLQGIPPVASFQTPAPTQLSPSPRPISPVYPPTRIVIPSASVDAPIIPTRWELRKVAGDWRPVWAVPDVPYVGWHQTSASLGQPGNTVLSGHNWPENSPFRFLYKVRVGDPVILYSGSLAFTYRVDEVLILAEAGQPLKIRLANARYAQPTDDERVTLITCHPYGSNRFRLIVIARPDHSY